MVRENAVQDTERSEKVTLAESFRHFSRAIEDFSDFDRFRASLARALEQDRHFAEMLLSFKDDANDNGNQAAEATFKMGNVVLPLQDDAEGNFIRVAGRRDARPFNAEDLHLMGSIAGFISVLTLQARKFRQSAQAEEVLKYLINKLPLGVVCFNSEHELIVESHLAAKTLGESGRKSLLEMLQNEDAFVAGRLQGHFEADGRLVYTEARRMKVASGLEVTAVVLYDLSNYREKFFTELELEAYRTHSRGKYLTLALLRGDGRPGECYRKLVAAVQKTERDDVRIRPLDAYATACMFTGQGLRSARSVLSAMLCALDDPLELALLPVDGPLGENGATDSFIDRGYESLLVARQALLPELIVLDPYPAVHEAISLITADVCRIQAACAFEEAMEQVRSGRFDGLFIDMDSFQDAQFLELKAEADRAVDDFKVFFCSCQQPEMLRQRKVVGSEGTVLCKPFQADKIVECLNLQFNLA